MDGSQPDLKWIAEAHGRRGGRDTSAEVDGPWRRMPLLSPRVDRNAIQNNDSKDG